jgi:hypothetical protein
MVCGRLNVAVGEGDGVRVRTAAADLGVGVLVGGRIKGVRVGAGVSVGRRTAGATSVLLAAWQPTSRPDSKKIATSKKQRDNDRHDFIFVFLRKRLNMEVGAVQRPPCLVLL